MYTNLEMMYADHVFRKVGGRTIESVPAQLRPAVEEILKDMVSKPEGEESSTEE